MKFSATVTPRHVVKRLFDRPVITIARFARAVAARENPTDLASIESYVAERVHVLPVVAIYGKTKRYRDWLLVSTRRVERRLRDGTIVTMKQLG